MTDFLCAVFKYKMLARCFSGLEDARAEWIDSGASEKQEYSMGDLVEPVLLTCMPEVLIYSLGEAS